MEIIRRDDYVTLPTIPGLQSGLRVRRPTELHYKIARRIRAKQEELYAELQRLPNTELGHGRALSIRRLVTRLENDKHPCLRVWNEHLFPEMFARI